MYVRDLGLVFPSDRIQPLALAGLLGLLLLSQLRSHTQRGQPHCGLAPQILVIGKVADKRR
jgi:hypothetical protein